MDILSKFLALHPVVTTLDWKCELSSPWRLVNEGTVYGTAPYHLIIEGYAWLEMEGKETLPLAAGDILMLPHGSSHVLYSGSNKAPLPEVLPATVTALGTLKVNGSAPKTEILCGEFILDPVVSNLLIQSLPEVVLIRTQNRETYWHLYQLLQVLKKETQEQMLGSHIIAEHLSSALFSLLIRGWITEAKIPGNVLQLLTEPRLYPAVQSLLWSPGITLSLQELASMCHMSRATFIRLFKQVTGYSPANLMTAIRLMQAAKLLSKPGISISAICEMMGYSSEPSFHRLFKQKIGMSPGEYRRKQLSKIEY